MVRRNGATAAAQVVPSHLARSLGVLIRRAHRMREFSLASCASRDSLTDCDHVRDCVKSAVLSNDFATATRTDKPGESSNHLVHREMFRSCEKWSAEFFLVHNNLFSMAITVYSERAWVMS